MFKSNFFTLLYRYSELLFELFYFNLFEFVCWFIAWKYYVTSMVDHDVGCLLGNILTCILFHQRYDANLQFFIPDIAINEIYLFLFFFILIYIYLMSKLLYWLYLEGTIDFFAIFSYFDLLYLMIPVTWLREG